MDKNVVSKRINGLEYPAHIKGGKKLNEVLNIVSKYAGMSKSNYIRMCINNQIMLDHEIDISKIDDIRYRKIMKLENNIKELIQKVMDSDE